MDVAALPGMWEGIKTKVAAAAVPVSDAMGKTYETHLVNVTLTESGSHSPVTETPAAPGRPPAVMPGGVNGSLRGSVAKTPAVGGGGIGTCTVAPHVIYAATQEWGGVHTAKRGPFMWLWLAYIGYVWPREEVTIPDRPYMRTAVKETIANGSLGRSAATTFEAVVWGG